MHPLHRLCVQLPESHARARGVLQKLFTTLRHASLFVLLQRFPPKRLHARHEAPLDQVVIHSQAVSRLHLFDHSHHLRLILLREPIEHGGIHRARVVSPPPVDDRCSRGSTTSAARSVPNPPKPRAPPLPSTLVFRGGCFMFLSCSGFWYAFNHSIWYELYRITLVARIRTCDARQPAPACAGEGVEEKTFEARDGRAQRPRTECESARWDV